jgi:hypothetical protein
VLSVEELEALRLAHKEGLYQQAAAERMALSRATFGRVLDARTGRSPRPWWRDVPCASRAAPSA